MCFSATGKSAKSRDLSSIKKQQHTSTFSWARGSWVIVAQQEWRSVTLAQLTNKAEAERQLHDGRRIQRRTFESEPFVHTLHMARCPTWGWNNIMITRQCVQTLKIGFKLALCAFVCALSDLESSGESTGMCTVYHHKAECSAASFKALLLNELLST